MRAWVRAVNIDNGKYGLGDGAGACELETAGTSNRNPLCAEFMWMFRENGLEHYKHIDTRRYLILDAKGRSYMSARDGYMVRGYISGRNSAGLWRQSMPRTVC